MLDGKAIGDELARITKEFLEKALAGVRAQIDALEAKVAAIPAGPAGEKGADGAPGRDGEHGKAGAAGVDGKDGAPGPQGERGEPGPEGPAGPPGAPGERGLPGEKGIDGRDGRDGLPGANGKDGAPGADGRDGFGLEDFTVEMGEDGRTLRFKFARGDVAVEREVRLANMIYRGVWREGAHEPGDVVTYSGSSWHCNEATTDKPGTSPAWRLMVKRGADGKDAGDQTRAPAAPVRLR